MTWLYILALMSWGAVLAYMTPAVWSVYTRQSRTGDPARLVCFLYAFLMCGFLTRRLTVGATDGWTMGVLLIGSASVAGITLYTARGYGRGNRV